MTIFIVRHGYAFNNIPSAVKHMRTHGVDTALTPHGRHQATRLGKYIRRKWRSEHQFPAGVSHIRFSRIYVSPMRRCLETAILLRGSLDVPMIVHPDAFEYGGLDWPTPDGDTMTAAGYLPDEIEALAPRIDASALPHGTGWWQGRSESTEEGHERCHRVAKWVDEMSHDPALEHHGSLCLVTHGTFGNHLVAHLLADGPAETARYGFLNTGVTRIEIAPRTGRRVLWYHNQLVHLKPEQITG